MQQRIVALFLTNLNSDISIQFFICNEKLILRHAKNRWIKAKARSQTRPFLNFTATCWGQRTTNIGLPLGLYSSLSRYRSDIGFSTTVVSARAILSVPNKHSSQILIYFKIIIQNVGTGNLPGLPLLIRCLFIAETISTTSNATVVTGNVSIITDC